MFVIFLLLSAIFAIVQALGWQSASFDIDDPEAARAKYAEITAIEDFSEQGQAWCSLTERELRAIARHTEMSNIVTTTIHTSSAGEATTTVVVEPAPNQDELVESAVRWASDSCLYNAWTNFEKLQTIEGESSLRELLCQLSPEEAAVLVRFGSVGLTEVIEGATSQDGSSTEVRISRPEESVDEGEAAAWMEELSSVCAEDGG